MGTNRHFVSLFSVCKENFVPTIGDTLCRRVFDWRHAFLCKTCKNILEGKNETEIIIFSVDCDYDRLVCNCFCCLRRKRE